VQEPETWDEAIANVLQKECGRRATHAFRRGDVKARPSRKAHNRTCGQLGVGRDYQDEIYLCDDHRDEFPAKSFFFLEP